MKPTILSLALAQALCVGAAHAQVVADSACEKYAVDIAAFATCDSPTRVARADSDEDAAVTPPADGKKPEIRPAKELAEPKKPATKAAPVRER